MLRAMGLGLRRRFWDRIGGELWESGFRVFCDACFSILQLFEHPL